MSKIIADALRAPEYSSFWNLCADLDATVKKRGVAALSPTARIVYLSDRYDGGMAQGGFTTLMLWDPELDIMQMIGALACIGAKETAQVLLNLARLFPGRTIPTDLELRRRQFNDHVSPQEEELDRLEQRRQAANEDVVALTMAFAWSHRTDLMEEHL